MALARSPGRWRRSSTSWRNTKGGSCSGGALPPGKGSPAAAAATGVAASPSRREGARGTVPPLSALRNQSASSLSSGRVWCTPRPGRGRRFAEEARIPAPQALALGSSGWSAGGGQGGCSAVVGRRFELWRACCAVPGGATPQVAPTASDPAGRPARQELPVSANASLVDLGVTGGCGLVA